MHNASIPGYVFSNPCDPTAETHVTPGFEIQQKCYHFPQFCVGIRAYRHLRTRFLARSGGEEESFSALQLSRPHPCGLSDHYGHCLLMGPFIHISF